MEVELLALRGRHVDASAPSAPPPTAPPPTAPPPTAPPPTAPLPPSARTPIDSPATTEGGPGDGPSPDLIGGSVDLVEAASASALPTDGALESSPPQSAPGAPPPRSSVATQATPRPTASDAACEARPASGSDAACGARAAHSATVSLDERSGLFFFNSPTPHFPRMSHPVSPIWQKLILFFRFFWWRQTPSSVSVLSRGSCAPWSRRTRG